MTFVKSLTLAALMMSAFVSNGAIFASAHHDAAASTRALVKTKIASAKTAVKTPTTKPKPALVFSAWTNKKVLKAGESMLVTMRVRNVSRNVQVLNFPTGRSFDVVVSAGNGLEPVWHWSRGRMFTQMMRDVSLAPGQSQMFTAAWNRIGDNDKAVAPGKYQVAARLTTIGAGIEAAPIVITLK